MLKHGPHTMATDVYAFGMLLYEVLFRREPFVGESSEVRHHMGDMPANDVEQPSSQPVMTQLVRLQPTT